MMSRSSFLGSLKENSKRRLWVWVLALLAFVLALPLGLAMQLSLAQQQLKWLTESYGVAAANEITHRNILETVEGMLGASAMLAVFTAVFAVLNGVQGFSWLYSRKKIDFYMGMPVKRSKRFLVIWLNGILIYFIPYILGIGISMLIAAGNQGLDGGVVKVIVEAMFVHLLLYLCVYHMAMLAVMLTGNMVLTGMGFLVFCLYEWLVRRVDYVYKARFFRYFSTSEYDTGPVFSPFSMYSELTNTQAGAGEQIKIVIMMFVFAVLLGAVSYVCYRKRPAESAGWSMVFSITKPVIKVLLVVPMALTFGDVIASEVSYFPTTGTTGIWYVIFALILAVLLGSAVIQVIYEFDIKGALHKKRHILISGALTALLFMVYRYDLFSYDSFVPDPDQVESIVFLPDQYEQVNYRSTWISVENGHINDRVRIGDSMNLKNAGDVCGLARYSMEEYDRMFPMGEEIIYDEDADNYWSSVKVIYRMKSGREVVRRLWVDVNDEKSGEYLDRIIGSKEFKEGCLVGTTDGFEQIAVSNDQYQVNAYYGNLIYEQKLREAEISKLLECYRADMEKFNFTRAKESVPAGALRFEFSREISNGYYSKGTAISEVGMNIYPFFEESIAYLKELGYYMDLQINVEDVDRIYVTNQNSEAYRKMYELQKTEEGKEAIHADMPEAAEVYGVYDIDTRGYVDYTEREDIEKLAGCIYAREMLEYRWDNGCKPDYDYTVFVYFKADSEMSRKAGTYAEYRFKEGEVPLFVQEDTAFQMPE